MSTWSDRKFLFVSCAVAFLIAIAPYAIGQALTPRGAMFFGNRVVAPADFSIYYSYIVQGSQGHIFMYDAFTSEAHSATIFQPLWFVVGQLQAALHLSVPVIFALARYLTIPIFLFTLWWAAGWLWPKDQLRRRTGFVFSIIASGLGGIVVSTMIQKGMENIWIFPDMWVSEAYSVLTLWSSPHFLLVTSGIIFVLVAVERSWLERRWSWALWAGVVALAVFSLHPFHVLTWTVIWFISTLWRWVEQRRIPWGYVGRWLLVISIGSPMLIFYLLQLLTDPITIGRAVQNINLSGSPAATAVGIGIPLILAIFGAWFWRPRDDRWRWVIVVAIGYVIAIYAPVAFQRRLSQGMMLPFAWLSVPILALAMQRMTHRSRVSSNMFIVAAMILISSTWIIVGGLIVKEYIVELQSPRRMYYISQEHQQLYTALAETNPHQPILGSLIESNVAAGLTAHQVYVGYGVETLRFGEKLNTMADFYTSMSESQQRTLLSQESLCYVMTSPRTKAYGNAFRPEQWPDLQTVWSGPTLALYRTPYCK